MKDADIEAVLQKQYGAPKAAPVAAPTGQTATSRLLGDNPLSDLGSVVGSHLKNLVAGPYHAFADAPRNPEEAQEKGTGPNSGPIANALGQFGLGAARMFVNPTIDSGRAAISSFKAGNKTDAANHAMDAIPIAGPWAKSIEDDAQTHGALPALAGLGVDIAAPAAISKGLGAIREAAPSMAEGAMAIRRGDRGFGKTPGRAILDETSGVRPETVGKQAQGKLNQLVPQIDSMAAAHTGTLDTTPAIQSIQDAIDTAATRNNAGGMKALEPVKGALTTNATTGLGLSPNQSATGVLNLKRGLRDQFVKNWSPDAASVLTRDTARNASHILDSSLDNALGPDFEDTNQRISSLIPVSDAAEKLGRADELPQRFGDKLRAHTGALTSAIGGALAGGHSGGLLGAIGGGTLGFALPEIMGGPTARMALARGMDSSVPGALVPALASGGIVTPKKVKK
jgi:hypothetical protein